MKRISTILCTLATLSVLTASSNEKPANSKADERILIIAVNTEDGSGYFTDEKGQLLFGKKFDRVEFFGDDMLCAISDGKEYLMTTGGDIISEDPFKRYEWWMYCGEGMATVSLNDRYGCANVKGELVIPCISDYPIEFVDSLASIEQGCKWGFIDVKGNIVVPCIYDYVADFSEGLAEVGMNGKSGYIDRQGRLIIPCIYDEQDADGYHYCCFSGGYAPVRKGGLCGLLNTKGQLVLPCVYHNIGEYTNYAAQVEKNGKWGIVDMNGKQLVPMAYGSRSKLPDGFLSKDDVASRTHVFDLAEGVSVSAYDDMDNPGKSNYAGYDYVYQFSEGLACVKKNGKLGYINKAGELVIPCKYDSLDSLLYGDMILCCNHSSYYFENGLVIVALNGKGLVINTKGDIVDKHTIHNVAMDKVCAIYFQGIYFFPHFRKVRR